MKCIISCEHASNTVPPVFADLFKGKAKTLASHQAYDQGAAKMAEDLAQQLNAKLYLGSITRLLIDLNRSPANRKSLFSPYSKKLGEYDRGQLLSEFYQPYRTKITDEIAAVIRTHDPVLHISIHTFSPVKKGKVRKADLGLLYDPGRQSEKMLCAYLAAQMKRQVAGIRVRRNYPYQGKTDGFTTFLRKKYQEEFYAGIEIEINQELLFGNGGKVAKMKMELARGIKTILQQDKFNLLTNVMINNLGTLNDDKQF